MNIVRAARGTLASAVLVGLALLLPGAELRGADPPPLEPGRSVIGSGATRGAGANAFALEGTIVQVDARRGDGAANLVLEGGFWPIAAATPRRDTLFSDSFEQSAPPAQASR